MIGFRILNGKFRTACNVDWWCDHLAWLVIAVGSLAQEKMIFYEVLLCYVMSSGVYANVYRRINSCINGQSCCVDMYGRVQAFETILERFKGTKECYIQSVKTRNMWFDRVCKCHRSWTRGHAAVMVTLYNKVPFVNIRLLHYLTLTYSEKYL